MLEIPPLAYTEPTNFVTWLSGVYWDFIPSAVPLPPLMLCPMCGVMVPVGWNNGAQNENKLVHINQHVKEVFSNAKQ